MIKEFLEDVTVTIVAVILVPAVLYVKVIYILFKQAEIKGKNE